LFTPWNLYPASNVDTNGHIEVEHFNLVKPDGPVPLGPAPPAALNRVHPVKFTPVTAKFTPLNPQRQFNWGVFHWGLPRGMKFAPFVARTGEW